MPSRTAPMANAVQAMPTREAIVRGLEETSIQFSHRSAAAHPPLSPRRCRFLCKWIMSASGGDMFSAPVPWKELGLDDYPSFVSQPIDLGTISASIADDAFDFAAFLDSVRLVWSNACRYNPPGNRVHEQARRLACIFDAKVIDMQEAGTVDDDALRLSSVYAPLVCALEQRDGAHPFVHPVDLQLNPTYTFHIEVPSCLSDVQTMLTEARYVHRDDVEADLRRIWTNAVSFCGEGHWISDAATHLSSICERLLAHRRYDVDLRCSFSNVHRLQLLSRIGQLSDADRLSVVQKMRELNQDSIVDLQDGTSTACIDSLSAKQFLVVDTLARKKLNPSPVWE